MEHTIITGYAHLASALVNGDYSGLDAAGRADLKAFLAYIEGYNVVSVEGDEYFGRPDFFALGSKGMVVNYVCMKRDEA